MTTLSDTRRSQQTQYRDAVILCRWDTSADVDTMAKVYVGITRICLRHHMSSRYMAHTQYRDRYSVEISYDSNGQIVHPQKYWLQECLVGRLSCCVDANTPPYAGETRWTDETMSQFEMYCGDATGWVIDPSQDFVDKLPCVE